MSSKVRLNIKIKLWNNGKPTINAHKRIKSRILALAQEHLWGKAYLRVTYDYNRRFFNDGEYYNFQDLKESLSAFTEKALLDYILGGKNDR